MIYSDTNTLDEHYEQYLGFYWSDDTSDEHQNITISFQLSEEMKEDYPHSIEDETDISVTNAVERREMWVAHNIEVLLDFGFVTYVHDDGSITSVKELEENIDRMDFNVFSR